MESPQLQGNTTTDSISSQLFGTHINRTPAGPGAVVKGVSPTISSALYAGQQFIQYGVSLGTSSEKPLIVLRRVEDSYVNVSQMLQVLVALKYFSPEQVQAFINNEVISNPQYTLDQKDSSAAMYTDLSHHELPQVRGVWVPYDKAVAIAVKFDLYKILRRLFLVDVHDYDKLPVFETTSPMKAEKRTSSQILDESPTKKRKTSLPAHSESESLTQSLLESILASNTNSPSLLPPVTVDENNSDLIAKVKVQFSEIFKNDGGKTNSFTSEDIASRFSSIFQKCSSAQINASSVLDVPLDALGRTALHYAATLASPDLVGNFIQLKICSPIRGDNNGESALVASIQVTNSMERGNFTNLLSDWLWPNLWLFDSKHQSILHHLILVATNNYPSGKFYFQKILEWVISNPDQSKNLNHFCKKIVNAKESQDGNTALHWAGNNELKWFIYLLLELNADTDISNNVGVKPMDFDCVKQVSAIRNTYKQNQQSASAIKVLCQSLDVSGESEEFLILLVLTGVEFLNKLTPYNAVEIMEEYSNQDAAELKPEHSLGSNQSMLHSSRILSTIQELLATTNSEFEKVISTKKAEINNLNHELRDATILTANNRFVIKKVTEKINQIDSLKLQLANVNEKLQMLKAETSESGGAEDIKTGDDGELQKISADDPFVIKSIFDKVSSDEPIEATPEILLSLPPVNVLRAQLAAYEELNANLEKEAECLRDYSALTAKFKKVVSFCTGVNVEEVDDLLDGLLEAVEGQQ